MGDDSLLEELRQARRWWRGGHWWDRDHPRERQGSAYIPAYLRRLVVAMDRGRCVYCGAPWRHVDHGVPWRFGGLTQASNLFLLCARHNLIKGAYWRSPAGTEYYPHGDPANLPLARAIRAREVEVQWAPGRWLRAGFAVL